MDPALTRKAFAVVLVSAIVAAAGPMTLPGAEAHFCPGHSPRLHDPWREERPFALRNRCPELPRPSKRLAEPASPAKAASPDRHRGSPYSGLSGSPHSFGPMFNPPGYFFGQ